MNRAELVLEIKRVEGAIKRTKSKYCNRDFAKYLKRLRKELLDYDRYH